jgi:hypothetical protein
MTTYLCRKRRKGEEREREREREREVSQVTDVRYVQKDSSQQQKEGKKAKLLKREIYTEREFEMSRRKARLFCMITDGIFSI